jgi:hypothetical protein
MKKFLIPSLIMLVLTTACKKDNNDDNTPELPALHFTIKWDHKYSYWLNMPDNLHNLVATPDGGAAIFFSWFTDDNAGTCLLKTNADGSTDFLKEFPITEFDCGDASIIQTSDNGFLVFGGWSPPFLGKTDAAGNIIWKKLINYHQMQRVSSVVEKTTGGFLALTESIDAIYLVDLNASGDTLRTFQVHDSLEIADGQQVEFNAAGQIIVLYSGRQDSDYRSFMRVYDTNFSQIWSQELTEAGCGIVLHSFYINPDNSLVTGGSFWTNGTGNYEGYIASISSTGIVNCTKHIPEAQYGFLDILPSRTGGYYLVAEHDIMITKISNNCELLWRESLEPQNQIGPSGNTLKISGNDILFFGNTWELTSMEANPVLIKFSE